MGCFGGFFVDISHRDGAVPLSEIGKRFSGKGVSLMFYTFCGGDTGGMQIMTVFVTNFSIAILMLDRTLAVFNFLNKKITLLIYLAIIMRIECIDEDGVSGNPIKVIE